MSKPGAVIFGCPASSKRSASRSANPGTGAEHRARIEMPEGIEFRIAEAGSGTTRTTGQILLPDLESTHAQFAHIHFSNKGVVD